MLSKTIASPPGAAAAETFHALSDATRLQIIGLLQNGERCVCDLTDAIECAQSRLSFHLRTLKDAGIITDRRDGRWIYYSLNRPALAAAGEYLDKLASAPSKKSNKCCT